MWFFYVVALPLVGAAVVAAALWLPSKSTGWFVRLDVGLAWFAALATLILVPTDVATTLAGNQPGYLSAWWLAAYWWVRVWGAGAAGRGGAGRAGGQVGPGLRSN